MTTHHSSTMRVRGSRAVAPVLALAMLVSSCNDDGREMREPGPDQTASIITTTVPTDTVGLETLPPFETEPLDDPGDGSGQQRPSDDALAVDGFEVVLPWPEGGEIARRFGCDGQGVSPTVRWLGVPEGAVEMAVIVTDVTPGAAEGFLHWAVAGLEPSLETITEDAVPASAIEGTNDFGPTATGWGPPCPPPGETHTYRVEVHALSQQVELPDGATGSEVLRSVDFATIAMAVSEGTYTRAG